MVPVIESRNQILKNPYINEVVVGQVEVFAFNVFKVVQGRVIVITIQKNS